MQNKESETQPLQRRLHNGDISHPSTASLREGGEREDEGDDDDDDDEFEELFSLIDTVNVTFVLT